jgi:hypothetical protein
LRNLSPDVLVGRFEKLENDAEELRPHLNTELERYPQALNALYAILLAEPNGTARIAKARR